MRTSLSRVVLAALSSMVLAAGPAAHGASVSVRLVEAHNQAAGVDRRLADVEAMLKSNLPYSRFEWLDAQSVDVPGSGVLTLSQGFVMHFSGSPTVLNVSLLKDGQSLLKTTLDLQKKKPFILGGFRSARGRYLLVLVAR